MKLAARLHPQSLRTRLSLALSAVLLAAGGLLAFGLQDFPRRLVEDYVAARLEHDAELLYARTADALGAAAPAGGGVPAADPATSADTRLAAAARAATDSEYRVPLSGHYFVLVHGATTVRSRSLWDEDLALPPIAAGAATVRRLPGPAGQQLLLYARRFGSGGGALQVAVAEDISALDARIADFRRALLAGAVLALAALLVLQRRLLAHGLAPLAAAADACRRLERGEAAPLDTPAPAEVAPMVEAVNRLVRHQTQRLARVRHAAGNLSHALKTPLAVLGQRADELDARGDAALATAIRSELATMQATIERELRRARLSGGAPGGGFDAQTQLDALADALRRLHGNDFVIELDVPARRFPFDREDMLELFGNLLDNAGKWARRVRLRIEPAALAPAELHCTIDDDGPGVDDALLERLGTAGLRGDEARPGHGLGLAIVGDIVAQHGGRLAFSRSPVLGGLRVELRLPLPA